MIGGKIIDITSTHYVKEYNIEEWGLIKNYYNDISHIKQIPEMRFIDSKIITKVINGPTLLEWYPLGKNNQGFKKQMISFINQMNKSGYAHCDLNPKNIMLEDEKLFVIDWDYLTPNRVSLLKHYDLTGCGLPSPNRTNNTHIFKNFPINTLPKDIIKTIKPLSFYKNLKYIPSVASMLDINLKDFIIKFD